jgi:4-amino-4-deoxy-L-arabinose transferase-like glycosyltransferase
MTPFRGFLVLLGICLSLYFHDLARTDLWSAHEARAAQNAQRMIDDDAWALPKLYDDQPEMQKPPAFYWMAAAVASLRDGVVDRWAVRLPAALAGMGTVLLVWWFLTERGRPLAGLIAGISLAVSIHFTSAARTGRIDMPLTFCITSAMFLIVARMHHQIRIPLAGSILAFALLLKGPIGIVLPAAALTVWLAISAIRWTLDDDRAWFALGGSCLFGTALALPWFFWINDATNGDFLRSFFWHHNVERATGGSTLASHPWWYYGPRFVLDFLPSTPLLLWAMVAFVRRRTSNSPEPGAADDLPRWRSDAARGSDNEAALGLVWMATVIGLLSLAQFKRGDYLLPAYPGAALLIGCMGEKWYVAARARTQKIAAYGSALLVCACLAGWWWFHHYEEPRMEAARAQQAFAAHIRERAPAPQTILMFRAESHLLAYHLGRPIHTLVEWGELNERLAEPGTHWFVTRAEFVDECHAHISVRPVRVAARSEEFSSTKPLRPLVLMRTD